MIAPIGLNTNVVVTARDMAGRVVQRERAHNLITNVGLNQLRDRLQNSGPLSTPITHMALGTSSAAVTPQDILLGTEVYRDAFSSLTPTEQTLVVRLVVPGGSANGNTITEAGIFDTVTANVGNLFARVVFPGVSKTAAVTLTVDWTLTFNNLP